MSDQTDRRGKLLPNEPKLHSGLAKNGPTKDGKSAAAALRVIKETEEHPVAPTSSDDLENLLAPEANEQDTPTPSSAIVNTMLDPEPS